MQCAANFVLAESYVRHCGSGWLRPLMVIPEIWQSASLVVQGLKGLAGGITAYESDGAGRLQTNDGILN